MLIDLLISPKATLRYSLGILPRILSLIAFADLLREVRSSLSVAVSVALSYLRILIPSAQIDSFASTPGLFSAVKPVSF